MSVPLVSVQAESENNSSEAPAREIIQDGLQQEIRDSLKDVRFSCTGSSLNFASEADQVR